MRAFQLFVLSLVLCLVAAFPAQAGVKAVIDKSEQLMYVYENGVLAYPPWDVSTGLKDTYTPTGTFHPYKTYAHHISATYGKPMVWAVYYKGTRAIHGTDGTEDGKLGKRASMGCTHTTNEHAKIFFDLAYKYGFANTTIVIQQLTLPP